MPLLTPKTYQIALIKIRIQIKCIKTMEFMFKKTNTFWAHKIR